MKTQIPFLFFLLCSCQQSEAGNIQLNAIGWSLLIGCVVFMIVGFYVQKDQMSNAEKQSKGKTLNITPFIYIGTYIGGFKNYSTKLPLIFINTDDKELHFFYYSVKKKFGPLFLDNAILPIDQITDVKIVKNNELRQLIKEKKIPLSYVTEIGKLKTPPDSYISISNKLNSYPLLFAFYDSDSTVNYHCVLDILQSICDGGIQNNNANTDNNADKATQTNPMTGKEENVHETESSDVVSEIHSDSEL